MGSAPQIFLQPYCNNSSASRTHYSMGLRSIFCLLLLGSLLNADTPTATVTGTVTDSSGGVLSAATVTAKDLDTGVTRSTTTNQSGVYLFLVLQAGAYEISPTRSGFNTTRR